MTPHARRTALLLAAALVLLAAAHLVDWWAYRSLHVAGINDKDWGRFLRSLGYAPTWIVLALALWLEARGRADAPAVAQRRAAGAILLALIVGGLGAELLKLLIRRERPDSSGVYHFRSLADDPLSSSRLGMPSSHAAVAFGGPARWSGAFPGRRRCSMPWRSAPASRE